MLEIVAREVGPAHARMAFEERVPLDDMQGRLLVTNWFASRD
jgi:hypothetical protein